MKQSNDRGASAVEFALVTPLLLAILLGIIAFGHAFHVQSVLSNAARDAVRVVALQASTGGADPAAEAVSVAAASAEPSARLTANHIDISPSSCQGNDATATVVITYPMELLGGIGHITLTGKGTMRCNG